MNKLVSLILIFCFIFSLEALAEPSKPTRKKISQRTSVAKKVKPKRTRRPLKRRTYRKIIMRDAKADKITPYISPPPPDEQVIEKVLSCSTYFCYVKFKSGEEGYSEVFEPGIKVFAPKKRALYVSKEKMERRIREIKTLRAKGL